MLSVPSHTVCAVELFEFSEVQSLLLVVVVCPVDYNSKQITQLCHVYMLQIIFISLRSRTVVSAGIQYTTSCHIPTAMLKLSSIN